MKREFPDPMPLALIEWIDSQATGGWEHLDDLRERVTDPERMRCRTAGFLLHRGPKSITIVLSLASDQAAEGVTIPREAIKSIVYLQPIPKKRRKP